MAQLGGTDITATFAQIPCGLFVLASAFEGARSGVLTRWVQPCSINPPQMMIAVVKGSAVESLIRDSRVFALSQISAGDRLVLRAFAAPPGGGEDPFLSLPTHAGPSGSPVIDRALSYLDCQLVRHVDLDADHRLFIGEVLHAAVIHPECEPAVVLGFNGRMRTPAPPKDERPGGTD